MKVFCVRDIGIHGELMEARKPTDKEAAHFTPEALERLLFCTGVHVDVPFLHFDSVPRQWWDSRKIYDFPGGYYRAIEVTDEEWNELVALNAQLEAEAAEKERLEVIGELEEIISRAERQSEIPSPEKARRMMIAWNNAENEGGEGYVPNIVDSACYAYAKERLAALKK